LALRLESLLTSLPISSSYQTWQSLAQTFTARLVNCAAR